MKVVEANETITYDAVTEIFTNLDPIAYPVEPYNEYLQHELKRIISNPNLTEPSFWIGS